MPLRGLVGKLIIRHDPENETVLTLKWMLICCSKTIFFYEVPHNCGNFINVKSCKRESRRKKMFIASQLGMQEIIKLSINLSIKNFID